MSDPQFDFERSRAYWRHVPSGTGKRDSVELTALDDDALCAAWDDGFRARFLNYPEEEQFLRTFAAGTHGRRLLSIGSGMGFHELYYAAAGADLTCVDIVDTNVAAIVRLARLKGLPSVRAHCIAAPADIEALGGGFDVVFLYGCIMHMPPAQQQALVESAQRALAPRGRLVLMVYSWEFARRLCGWTSTDQFDPVRFGMRSDPAVNGDVCPWADWHDDAKILALVPGWQIEKRQAWNDGQYLWYQLADCNESTSPSPFFAPSELTVGRKRVRLPIRRFEAADAVVRRSTWHGLNVVTGASRASYAATAHADLPGGQANAVVASIDMKQGGCSVGVLDDEAQRFVAAATIVSPGCHDVLLLTASWPRRARIVFSNHQPDTPAASEFVIRSVALVERAIAEPPQRHV